MLFEDYYDNQFYNLTNEPGCYISLNFEWKWKWHELLSLPSFSRWQWFEATDNYSFSWQIGEENYENLTAFNAVKSVNIT